jgi:putative ABC transport system permease protein
MLMIRSFMALQGTDPGFDPGGLFTARVITGGARYEQDAPRLAMFGQVLEGARTLPGATDAALASGVPLSGWSQSSGLNIEGQPTPEGERRDAEVRTISDGYFSVLGVRLMRGRAFTAAEVADAAPVAVVGRTLAERYWPGQDPVGQRINLGGDWLTVVGVAPDLRLKKLNESADEQVYLPYTAHPNVAYTLLVRTRGEPAALAGAVRTMVHALDPGVPVAEMFSMEDVAQRSLWQQRLFGGMFTAFGVIALLLAVTGVYAMMAYSVGQRTHEIGVRMALGARAGSVLGMVVREGMKIAAIGLAIGLVAAFGVTRVMKGILWGVSPSDPLTFIGIATLLGGVVLLASWLPARRAARVDPMVALRSE